MDILPLSGAKTLHPNSERENTPVIEYSAAAKGHILFRRQRMIAARDARDMRRPEFDDMPFLKWHEVMKRADDQYVAPRKNAQDTSISTGTIRDKNSTLVEYAGKYDFEPVAQVYDDSDEALEELAEVAEDMVRKSKLIEDYAQKAKLIYRSMVAFGVALVEDAWVERWVLEKTMQGGFRPGMGSDSVRWTERLVKQYDGCQAKLWDIRKCYFGDIRKFFMNGPQGQPYFFTVEYESYDVMKGIFGKWDRWKNVPTQVQLTPELSSASEWSSWWTLRPVTQYFVEKVTYYDPIANEIAITLNGVDMLPIMEREQVQADGSARTLVSGYPLTEVSPSGAIPFAKFDLEPMHEFAYSKGQTAKMRVWGDVENMMVKLFIRMLKQKSDPTMGNKSGRLFDSSVSDPATIINDVREGDLFPILPNAPGMSTSDFSMYEMVKKEIDKNSVERSFQGMSPSQVDRTATQDMNEMNAQSLKVAALFDGIISGENQLCWLRTYSIQRNWTKAVDTRVDAETKSLVSMYRTVSVPSEVDGGQKATRRIVFTRKTTMDSQDVHQSELDAQKNGGGESRTAYIHPEMFAMARLRWHYQNVPVPNGSDPLSYMLFAKQVVDAQTFFGPDSINVRKLKRRFAAITGNDFDTWFVSEAELDQKQQAAAQAAAQQQGQGPQAPGGQAPGGPSIAGAAKGAAGGQAVGSIMR